MKMNKNICKHLDDKKGKMQGGFGGRNLAKSAQVSPNFLFLVSPSTPNTFGLKKALDLLLYKVFFGEWPEMSSVSDLTQEMGISGLLAKV